MAERSRRGGTREVVLGLVVAAALLWGSSRLTWVTATTTDDLRGTRSSVLTGATWATGLVPLALVALAAVAAVLAVRGWALRVVAVLVLGTGVAAGLPGGQLLVSGAPAERAATLLDTAARTSTQVSTVGALLALLGGVVLLGCGVLLLRAPARAGGLSDRYQTPAARRASAVSAPLDDDVAERRIWDALDAGLDPTEDPAAAPGDPRGDVPHSPATLPPNPSARRDKGGETQ